MKSSTLPLTSPCSGTKQKTTVPLFFASTGGLRLLSFIPILLLSLQLIKFYSPSLRWFASTGGLRLLSCMPILHLSLKLINFYSPSIRSFASNAGSGCPSYRPILHLSLKDIIFSAHYLLLFPNPILDDENRHLPIRQIVPESSLLWGFYIVMV